MRLNGSVKQNLTCKKSKISLWIEETVFFLEGRGILPCQFLQVASTWNGEKWIFKVKDHIIVEWATLQVAEQQLYKLQSNA